MGYSFQNNEYLVGVECPTQLKVKGAINLLTFQVGPGWNPGRTSEDRAIASSDDFDFETSYFLTHFVYFFNKLTWLKQLKFGSNFFDKPVRRFCRFPNVLQDKNIFQWDNFRYPTVMWVTGPIYQLKNFL